MNVFCDESGGTDEANSHFVIAAVLITPHVASRLLKRFRKAAGIVGEVKGHALTFAQRRLFFDLLGKVHGSLGIVVTCSRHDEVGGWAMATIDERELYQHMLAESCGLLPLEATVVTITTDRPRYKRSIQQAIGSAVAQELIRRHPGCSFQVRSGDSALIDGVQIADVIANSVLHAAGSAADAPPVSALIERAVGAGVLVIRHAELGGRRPAWLMPETTRPPGGGLSDDIVGVPPAPPSE